MTPQELLEEGKAKQDWALVERALELIKKGAKVAKIGRPKKIVDLGKRSVKKKVLKEKISGQKGKKLKAPKFKNDEEYFAYLFNVERDKANRLIKGENISIIDNECPDNKGILKKEGLIKNKKGKLVDENILIDKSNKTPKRAPVSTTIRRCTKCGQDAEITIEMESYFCYDITQTGSEKPFFTCGKCGS